MFMFKYKEGDILSHKKCAAKVKIISREMLSSAIEKGYMLNNTIDDAEKKILIKRDKGLFRDSLNDNAYLALVIEGHKDLGVTGVLNGVPCFAKAADLEANFTYDSNYIIDKLMTQPTNNHYMTTFKQISKISLGVKSILSALGLGFIFELFFKSSI